MYALVASIVCSVCVSVLLKVARKRSVDVKQAIAFNYVAASLLCVVLLEPKSVSVLDVWPVLVSLGVLLPSVFLLMAGAVRHAGIVLSDAAQRLSLFLPLVAAVVVFGESIGARKVAGIAVALVALVCLVIKPAGAVASGRSVLLLSGVWAGYGVIDILFKQLSKGGTAFASSLLVTFSLAGLLSFIVLFAKRTRWGLRHAGAGLLLGALNFGNIWFYIRAHQLYADSPTLVFSAMNIGVISLGTLVGAGVFGERPTRVNVAGVGLAVVAIVVLVTG